MIAIRAPAGAVDGAADPAVRARAVLPAVAEECAGLVEGDRDRVMRAERLDDAVARRVGFQFGHEAAEQFVPDDEDASIVGVEIARIGGVMDAVMGGRVHHRLEPARHPADGLGMDPELVDEIQTADEEDEERVEADEDQRQAEQDEAGERAEPGLAEGRGEIIVAGGMVGHMLHPEPAHPVGEAVFPIIDEVIGGEEDEEAPPGHGDLDDPVGPGEHHHPQGDGACERVHDEIAGAHDQRGDGIAGFVAAVHAAGFHRPPFPDDGEHEGRSGERGGGWKLHAWKMTQASASLKLEDAVGSWLDGRGGSPPL